MFITVHMSKVFITILLCGLYKSNILSFYYYFEKALLKAKDGSTVEPAGGNHGKHASSSGQLLAYSSSSGLCLHKC